MRYTVARLLVMMAVLGIALDLASGSAPVSGWSALPGGGVHLKLTNDVMKWFDNSQWRFEGAQVDYSDWEVVWEAAVAPDAAAQASGPGRAQGLLLAMLNPHQPTMGLLRAVASNFETLKRSYHRTASSQEKFCTVYGCSYDSNTPAAERQAAYWIKEARNKFEEYRGISCQRWDVPCTLRKGDRLDEARFYAGYAIHYAQDAVNPPHVDPWGEGWVEGCQVPIPTLPAANAHTLWETRDRVELKLLGKGTADPSSPQRLSAATIEQRIVELAQAADRDWPGPAGEDWDTCPSSTDTACGKPLTEGSSWPIYDPFALEKVGDPCERALRSYSYSTSGFVVPKQTVERAYQRPAQLTAELMAYAFDFEPPGGWPEPPPPPGECTENVDVALIIDSSGSMSWNDPQNLRKEAARNFATAMQDKDQVAVVDFSSDLEPGEDARLLFPLGQRTTDPSAIYAAIERVGAYNATNIRAGMQKGFEQLNSSTQPNAKAAVLLSDGEHNTGGDYTDADHQPFKDNGWPIYTVGLHVGGTAGEALLRDIAQDTGGQYFNLTDAGQLVAAYNDIRNRVQCGETQLENTMLVAPGQTADVLAAIPPGQTSAAFLSNWAGSTVDMTLVDPNGRIIGPDSTDPDVAHIKGLVSELYRVTNPAPGTWTIRLYGVDVPPQGENVTVVVTTVAPPVPPDSTAPTSRVVVPQRHFGSLPIDLSFEAADPAGPGGEEPSGVKHVELWYRYRGLLKMPPWESLSPEQIRPQDLVLARGWSGWTQYDGTFAASPIPFTPPSGSGLYEFYTLAVDNAGNREEPPAAADARYLCIVRSERSLCVSLRWLLPVGLPKIIPASPGFGR